MTNASVKNTFLVLSAVAIIATALSLGAFATTVHAQQDGWGGSDGWGTVYDNDCGGSCGTSDWGGSDGWGTVYDNDCGGCMSQPEYSYEPYTYEDTYYNDSYSQPNQNYSQPSYRPSPSPTFYAPGYSAPQQPRTNTVYVPQQQQQQQQQQGGGGGPVNIVNNNVNTNTNTNVAPVSQATPQTIVQYVAQPNPIYYPVYQPTYNYPVQNTQLPYCVITATTGYNGLVTLSWSSSYATSAYISPSVGSVAPNGSTSLYNYGNSIYTMTVSGQGGSNTCRTSYVQPVQTPTVSLTQIPYTGFDLGPVGNAMYWLSLLSFAVAGASLLVYFLPRLMADKAGRGGAFALVGSTLGSFRRT